MKKSVLAATIAAVAVFAGVFYFAREPGEKTRTGDVPAKTAATPAKTVKPAVPAQPLAVSRSAPPSRPASADPRVAALMASRDDALIEYFSDPAGRLIKEIDNDPASQGYRRPLREFTYAGNQVIQVVTYHYLGDQVQVSKAIITYKADGSVDQFHESTDYQYGKKASGPG